MAKAGYAFQKPIENIAKASGRNLDISPKKAIEICAHIRGRPVEQAKRLLVQAIEMKTPIPLKRFTNGVGHKPGMGPGRFYPKVAEEVLKVVQSAESNAKNKGLTVANLRIVHIAAQRGPVSWHYGRKKRSAVLMTHLEVVVAEGHVKGIHPATVAKNAKKAAAKSDASKATDAPKSPSKKSTKKVEKTDGSSDDAEVKQ